MLDDVPVVPGATETLQIALRAATDNLDDLIAAAACLVLLRSLTA